MINKNNFPKLIFALVSLVAVIFSIGFFWVSFGFPYYNFVARYGIPAPNQKAPNFFYLGLLGILSGLALTLLLGLGAGMARWLARIKKPIVSLGVYLILPGALCICLPASIIFLSDALFAGLNMGGGDKHYLRGVLSVIAFLPAVFGFISVYIGAGISALSHWLAARIWHEAQEEKIGE